MHNYFHTNDCFLHLNDEKRKHKAQQKEFQNSSIWNKNEKNNKKNIESKNENTKKEQETMTGESEMHLIRHLGDR